jgi:hypothetical protein
MGVGLSGDVVELVSLGHGDRWVAPYVWVQVTVTGPLHGDDPARRSIDPRPMIAGELLNSTGAEFSTSDALEQAVQQVVERSFADIQINVDGRPESFRAWTEGDHWAALRDLEPDHLLYVIASNVGPSAIGLRRIDDDALRLTRAPTNEATQKRLAPDEDHFRSGTNLSMKGVVRLEGLATAGERPARARSA